MRDSYRRWNEQLSREEAHRKRDDSRNFIWIPIPFLSSLKKKTLDLAMLIHFQRKCRPQAEENNEGYFSYSIKEIEASLCITSLTESKMRRKLKALAKTGYIKLAKKGDPLVYHIWIDFDRFEKEHKIEAKEFDDRLKSLDFPDLK